MTLWTERRLCALVDLGTRPSFSIIPVTVSHTGGAACRLLWHESVIFGTAVVFTVKELFGKILKTKLILDMLHTFSFESAKEQNSLLLHPNRFFFHCMIVLQLILV